MKDIVISFYLSIVASVVAYYISKYLLFLLVSDGIQFYYSSVCKKWGKLKKIS